MNKKDNSVIVRMDDATKGIMKNITSGIAEPIRTMSSKAEEISDTIEETLGQARKTASSVETIRRSLDDVDEKMKIYRHSLCEF